MTRRRRRMVTDGAGGRNLQQQRQITQSDTDEQLTKRIERNSGHCTNCSVDFGVVQLVAPTDWTISNEKRFLTDEEQNQRNRFLHDEQFLRLSMNLLHLPSKIFQLNCSFHRLVSTLFSLLFSIDL